MAGGDDFKLYKFDYNTGSVLGAVNSRIIVIVIIIIIIIIIIIFR